MDKTTQNSTLKSIVITGSTRGIGYGLAAAFLERGCAVTVSGRAQAGVAQALESLGSQYGAERLHGLTCDVREAGQVQALWEAARGRFGQVDIWVNNAGLTGAQANVWQLSAEEARQVIETNLLGAIHGSQAAITGMLAQGFGAIYNMEGMGSDGRTHAGLVLYGTTKYALRYFSDSLVKETTGTGLVIGALRPGMVLTDLVTRQYESRPEEWQRLRRVFNLIAERAEVVAPWLAGQMLANREHGRRIRYLTTGRLLKRMALVLFRKRDLFAP